MHPSCWPLVAAAIQQSGAIIEKASAEGIRFRADSICIDLLEGPISPRGDELLAFADLGTVEDALRACCFEAFLSLNLDLFRGGGRSTMAFDSDGERVIFASRIPSPEDCSPAEFDRELKELCDCVADMCRELASLLADPAARAAAPLLAQRA